MELLSWIKKNKKTVVGFAKEIECDRSYLYAIIRGNKVPSKRLARDIEKATGGEISAGSLLHEIKKKPEKKLRKTP